MKTVKDPFGNEVYIRQEILLLTAQMKSGTEIFDDITKVIEKPAMMFKLSGSKTLLYYLRAVGWNRMMMIGAQKKYDHFELTTFEMDPSAKMLSDLYHGADQLI
jgi:hypothetical protein